MAHHAYLLAGPRKAGIQAARAFVEETLGLTGPGNPDITLLEYGLLSADDARRIGEHALQAPVSGDTRVLIISLGRLFHEAQNALLKIFEEPPQGLTLFLIVPSEGVLLETLRSRLVSLPVEASGVSESARAFLAASPEEREKLVAKLLARTKADKDEEKQAARLEVLELLEGLTVAAYDATRTPETLALLKDLDRFLPILHDRSAPIKLILEHLLIVLPKKL